MHRTDERWMTKVTEWQCPLVVEEVRVDSEPGEKLRLENLPQQNDEDLHQIGKN